MMALMLGKGFESLDLAWSQLLQKYQKVHKLSHGSLKGAMAEAYFDKHGLGK